MTHNQRPGRARRLLAAADPRDSVRALFAPGMWPAGRIVGEVVLSLVVGLLAAGLENLNESPAPQAVAVAVAAALLCPLRRVMPGR
ncbi:hypothetical protein [Saccharopolyspora taberi]|uniref:Uncharacterized protein n=1 Tax=Saccharopolyspora taberi TaxID=60895 RepID=A0ABN3VM73_9PSEU